MRAGKTAFITGITGQDGTLLAAFLLGKGYAVHGLVRWDCVDSSKHLENVHLHYGDMNDAMSIVRLLTEIQPDEIYNLAALTHVHVSFDTPASTFSANAMGALHVLEAARILKLPVRIYQASSSEMFGSAPAPQDEETKFEPCSPYGVAKLAAYWMARSYREAYGMHISNGILFNHESTLRGENFVTRKITRGVAAIEAGRQSEILLGNLESLRDWGHAKDFVRGMWMMLQREKPDDYVLATGETRSVRAFAEAAFAHIGARLLWHGAGVHEVGKDSRTGKIVVRIDETLFRPKEVHHLCGDATKAREKLGWQPIISFEELVAEMVNEDRASLREASWQKTG